MTGNERRKAILKLATINGNVSTRGLAQRFNVSRMTINRDLRSLEETGTLKPIHGGAIPNTQPHQTSGQSFCSLCDKPAIPHQSYQLQHPEQARETFCCAYCGLQSQLQNQSSTHYYATDMISGKSLPAQNAFFLIRSSATPCCHPSILTFADEAEVVTFRSAFGGVIGRIAEALDFLRTELTLKQSN